MIKKKLKDLVLDAKQNDNEAMMEIINMFRPLIKKYSRKLLYDGAESEIEILIIILVKHCPTLNKGEFIQDKDLISYINTSVSHEYIKLSKNFSKLIKMEIELNEDLYLIESDDNIENRLLINELLNKLPHMQRKVLEELFLFGCTATTLAKKLNISRQAVYKTRNKALNKLRKYIES